MKPGDVKPLRLKCRRCCHEVLAFGTDTEWERVGYEEDCPNCGAVLHIPRPRPEQAELMKEEQE